MSSGSLAGHFLLVYVLESVNVALCFAFLLCLLFNLLSNYVDPFFRFFYYFTQSQHVRSQVQVNLGLFIIILVSVVTLYYHRPPLPSALVVSSAACDVGAAESWPEFTLRGTRVAWEGDLRDIP